MLPAPHVEISPGLRLFVQQFGSGPAVVFVHAGGMTHEAWDHQVGALMGRYRTVAYDFRGIGASDRPPSGYGIDDLAEDLHALIQKLELGSPAVVAHGVGAHVALRLAAVHPKQVSRLALVSAAPWAVGDRSGSGGIPNALWSSMQSGLAKNRAQADLDLIDQQYFHQDPGEGMRLWCFRMALQWPLAVLNQLIAGFSSVDHRDALGKLRMPVLVMHGRHDKKNRYAGGVYLAEHIPNARLVTFEDSAVCPQLEEVEQFNRVLAEFLAEDPKAPA